jgi:hypothetical protein
VAPVPEPAPKPEPKPVPEAPKPKADDPVVLHAQGIGLVFDKQPERGLALMRRAHELAPANELMAFDLARMAREHGGKDEDQRAVLAVEATTVSTRLLQAYVLLDAGDSDGAAVRLEAALQQEPEHREAAELLQILRPEATSETTAGLQIQRKVAKREASRFTGRVRTSAVVDSNVTVLPEDAPSQVTGYRAQVDAAALFNLARGDFSADAGAALLYAPHLNERDELGLYDMFAIVGLVTLEHTHRVLVWDLDATVREVFLDSFADHFMQDFSGQMTARMRFEAMELGLYGRGGYRDFIERNPEDESLDRDGIQVGGGLVLKWKGGGGWSADVRAGYQAELTDGDDMKEGGPEARVALRWRWRQLGVRLLLNYVMRDYGERAAAIERTDQRITPQLDVRYGFTDWLAVRAGYALTRNLSQDAYDYTRHLGQLGVEATW